jgi:biopolymer transport protein ExbB
MNQSQVPSQKLRTFATEALRRAVPALALALAAGPLLAQDAAEKPPGTSSNVLDVIGDSGTIGVMIVILSVIALAMVIENFIALKRDKLAPPELIDEIQALFDDGQYQEAMELCENEPTFFTKVAGAGISKIGHSFEVIQQSIQEMGDEESIRLHQKIGWLALIANVAPMLGLLGTVQGMIISFNQIAASAGQANPSDLAGGISIALLTTLFGLLVAIPLSTAFAFIRNRLIRSVIEVGAIVEDLFERFRPANPS